MFHAVRSASHEYQAFRVGAQQYGIGIRNVKEIRNYKKPTRMLGARANVTGKAFKKECETAEWGAQ